jgi:hypothetical protein
MGSKLHIDKPRASWEFEDAVILDDTTATYAAAFATVCAGLGGARSAPGDENLALRLAQQMRTAAAAYWAGRPLADEVWLPDDASEQ